MDVALAVSAAVAGLSWCMTHKKTLDAVTSEDIVAPSGIPRPLSSNGVKSRSPTSIGQQQPAQDIMGHHLSDRQYDSTESIVIEQGKNLDNYSPRDLFHFFINTEDFPEKILLAKEFSIRSHAFAAEYMKKDRPGTFYPQHFTFEPYDRVKTEEKIMKIYSHLWKHQYSNWVDEGMPVTKEAGERYDIFWGDTRLHMTEWLIQRAPFNLTDGVWLRRIVPTGPITETDALLLSTFADELGNGDVSQNHCNVYQDILKSLGINLPDVRSRAFVDQEAILTSAFVKPVLTLATTIWSKTFYDEILGYNLWLELTSSCEHAPAAKLLERWSLNPSFSLLHLAIDNVENGHARNALIAIQKYLDEIEVKEGKEAVQQHWYRIWIGYTAYAVIGDFHPDLKAKFAAEAKSTPRDRFKQLIQKKARIAMIQHATTLLKGKPLNDWFDDPEGFTAALESSHWVVAGDPKKSLFMNHLCSFQGPMYQVFTTDELTTIALWILAMDKSPANDMVSLILAKRAVGQRAHKSSLQLLDGRLVPINTLFANPVLFMQALKQSGFCDIATMSGATAESARLVRTCLEGGCMARIFTAAEVDIIRAWVQAGAPLPPAASTNVDINVKAAAGFSFSL